jgi:hypothetical protein
MPTSSVHIPSAARGAQFLLRWLPHQEMLNLVGQRREVVAHEPDLLRGRLEFSATPLEDKGLIREGVFRQPAALQQDLDRAVQVRGGHAERQRVGIVGHRRAGSLARASGEGKYVDLPMPRPTY